MTKIEICADCLAYLANGEVWDVNGDNIAEDHGQAIIDQWDNIMLFLGGEDEGFSWQPCEGCGSRLGGDRFAAYADMA